MDLIVTSALVGYEKPDPRTYQAALEPLKIDPERAIHVGDQPKSDVVGALGVGMGAVLIDRYDRHNGVDVPTVSTLTELADMVVRAEYDAISRAGCVRSGSLIRIRVSRSGVVA